MQTIYDWLTVAIFAGLIVLFLQRSAGEHTPNDSLWQYLAAAIGCAVANYIGNDDGGHIAAALGNNDGHLLAVALVVGVLAYVWHVLKPFGRISKRH